MIYCIVEGQSDAIIMSTVLNEIQKLGAKIIMSNGFPSMPAVARTIMSYMDRRDKVLMVCDQDDFKEGSYGKDMLRFLLRGAMNNQSIELFVFNPNIDKLVSTSGEGNVWKGKPAELEQRVRDNIDSILKDETIIRILEFAK